MIANAIPTPGNAGRPPKVERQTIRVVLFSGGTGTQSIGEAMARHPQISLTVLINCYDDGHSTGRLRRYIPSMLGPSDVRKNITRLMPKGDLCYAALQRLSDYRLPKGIDCRTAWSIIESISLQRLGGLPEDVRNCWERLTVSQDRHLRGYCEAFLNYGEEQRTAGAREFDFTDCALGNIYFSGCYLQNGRNFNRTVAAFGLIHEIGSELLNITLGENLFLIAEKQDGTFLLSEADIVSCPAKIRRVLLVEDSAYFTRIEGAGDRPAEEIRQLVDEARREPKLNPRAAAALEEADIIIYGPGTQHSSLLPSYLTEGVGERIASNRDADKIFMANIRRDVDIQHDDTNDLADKFLECLSRGGATKIEWRDCVTHFFVQRTAEDRGGGYVPFDEKTFRYPLDTVLARDWEAYEGKHDGGFVFDELQQIIQSRIEISLAPKPYMVSIVVPALDERPTVEQTLKSLIALDFNEFGLSKEILLIDGGSADGTFEAAQSVRGVKAFRLAGPEFGRGAALRVGVNEARGNIIVFFPADSEYRAADVYPIVSQLLANEHSAVFGIRTAKVMDLSAHLQRIYKGHRVLYLVSKYGGLLISILTLVLYNRFISDALTSVKGFDAKLLRSLKLESNGVDLDAEIVAKLSRAQRYVLEVPVEFAPRTRAEGKKITTADGLRVIAALLKYRFRN